jgi:iron complex outermembrane receptor protein
MLSKAYAAIVSKPATNFTNTRQTRFGSIYTGTITNPVFKDIYAPLDGFVVNTGIKIKL